MEKKNKANLALGISAAGCVGTLALGGVGFLPGLLQHGFLAATIGGLADWFAVTAIFHKPLGISYRTDILRRNSQRIMEAIVQFASEDLLSTEHIMSILSQQDTGRLMAEYLQQRGGREQVQTVVTAVLLRSAAELDTQALARELAPAVRQGLQGFAVEDITAAMLTRLAEEQHSQRILQSLLTLSRQVLHAPAMQQVLLAHVTVLREAYERDHFGRNFLMGLLGLDDARILEIFNENLDAWLDKMLGGQTESYAAVRAGLEMLLRRLAQDESLQAMLARGKVQLLERIDIEGLIAGWMEANLKSEQPFWLTPLHTFIDQQIDHFCQSATLQRHFNSFLQAFLREELEKHHALIPQLIRERLDDLTDDQLVSLVESKVQDDLQMIRINGAIVGSLVGMGLYLLVSLAERMWGL